MVIDLDFEILIKLSFIDLLLSKLIIIVIMLIYAK